MKSKYYFSLSLLVLCSACIVVSYYPLYTERDLFGHDLLLGSWLDQDSTLWKFEYTYRGEAVPENIDSSSYVLSIREKDEQAFKPSDFRVHLVKLGDHYFLDFFLENYRKGDDKDLFDLHLVSVHSFARVDLGANSAHIRWFSQSWLKQLEEKGKLKLKYEAEDGNYLLTAPTKDLQRFVMKYANDSIAFSDAVEAKLVKQ